ncbi:hypothetical protein KDJ21_005815 [Metabacillus litoralis]|nr:hypothetical protein [Metabacillus litoralis]MCM3162515.1 hypothetical protein [Metabacillus litoralis]MCM3411696.1 hypothetical protein [Metabacillus litoralis]UHA61180.1 hypothetical protein KDJ21_005815 [Metabacillus litoralis]
MKKFVKNLVKWAPIIYPIVKKIVRNRKTKRV